MSALLTGLPYWGVFLVLFAEEAGLPLPVPGDFLIAALGAAGRSGRASFPATALIVLVATVGGSAILFELSHRVGHPILRRAGPWIGFNASRAARVERWLGGHGSWTIAGGRLVPGFRIILSAAAGALHMNRAKFAASVAVASVVWSAVYYWLGFALGAGVARAFGR